MCACRVLVIRKRSKLENVFRNTETLYKDGASGLQPQQCSVEHSRGENLKQLQVVTHLHHSSQKKELENPLKRNPCLV